MRHKNKATGGRPPKFREPRRPVTLTLPERVLERLARVNSDRARAIVKLIEMLDERQGDPEGVELVEVAPGKGVLIVGPSSLLRKIPGLHLVEVSPLRHLLVLDSGTSVELLEVSLTDMLEDLAETDIHERRLLDKLRSQLNRLRREGRITRGEIILFRTAPVA